jgi:excisionase family DNA binding protein
LDSTFTPPPASELGVSERTLRRYIQAGLIGFRRLPGGHYRIPREAIEAFWSEHAPRAAAIRKQDRLGGRIHEYSIAAQKPCPIK